MADTPTSWAVVVAGGSGARFGEAKQFAELGDRRVIDWSIAALRPHVAGVVVVLPAELVDSALDEHGLCLDADRVVAGGPTRSASVRAGLEVVPRKSAYVLIHDAARPLTSTAVVQRVHAALAEADAAVPVVPISDSLRHRDGPAVDRSEFVAVQTPQGFVRAAIEKAHRSGADATDDATLIDMSGGVVAQVEGDPNNVKITVRADLRLAELLLAELVLGDGATAGADERTDPEGTNP